MIRTRISLEKETYDAAKAEAERTGISLAEFLHVPSRPPSANAPAASVPGFDTPEP